MSNEVKTTIRVADEKHIWYEGRQYIRLDRFIELKTNQLNEMEILNDEIERLNEENNALKVLFKNKV